MPKLTVAAVVPAVVAPITAAPAPAPAPAVNRYGDHYAGDETHAAGGVMLAFVYFANFVVVDLALCLQVLQPRHSRLAAQVRHQRIDVLVAGTRLFLDGDSDAFGCPDDRCHNRLHLHHADGLMVFAAGLHRHDQAIITTAAVLALQDVFDGAENDFTFQADQLYPGI